MSWRELVPAPYSLWARWAPRAWPRPPGWFLDPRRGAIATGSPSRTADLPLDSPAVPDLTYLPPVAPGRETERDLLAEAIVAAGGVPLVHLGPTASTVSRPPAAGAQPFVDLLPAILDGALPSELDWPRQAWVMVPLLAGWSATEAQWRPWVERCVDLDAAAAIGLAPELAPEERRWLAAKLDESQWEALFHGAVPSERQFAALAVQHHLAPLPARPDVPQSPRLERNRRIATALAEAGTLWLRLGRSEVEGEALLAAGRRLGRSELDLAALAREGNLGLLDWLSPVGRQLMAESAGTESPMLDELRREWGGGSWR